MSLNGAPLQKKPGLEKAEYFAKEYGLVLDECKPNTKPVKLFDESGMVEKSPGSLTANNRPLFWLENLNQERVMVVYVAGDGNVEYARLKEIRLDNGSVERRWCRDDD